MSFPIMNKMMRLKFGQLAYASFSRFSADHGHNSLFTFKRLSALHHHIKPPIITTVDSRSSSIRASPTTYTSLAAARREYSSQPKYNNTFVGSTKREDIRRTKYDSAFSEWKVLIGPSDWKEHSMGKEGAERYRTHNLPNCTCSPGVYELAVAVVLRRSSGIVMLIPVYVGQTENIRNRLQDYGRNGAHLETNGLLVSDVLSRGFSIVYRWAPMKSKEEAEETEGEMLTRYDYAWNKRNNGDRRPDDVRRLLEMVTRYDYAWNKRNNGDRRPDDVRGILDFYIKGELECRAIQQ